MDKITFKHFLFSIQKKAKTVFFKRSVFGKTLIALLVFLLSANGVPDWRKNQGKNFKSWTWEIIKENQDLLPPTPPNFEPDLSHWSKRAGLQALRHNGKFYIFGGRSPLPPPAPFGASIIHGDGWVSSDEGKTWSNILMSNPQFPSPPTHWPDRAYFQAVKKGRYMYILGGQNFGFPQSDFFNDTWRSTDGINWTQMSNPTTSDSRWAGRAGLSAVVFKGYIYVMGGSQNDDCALLPPGTCIPGAPPPRKYFNDVWRSRNGSSWELVKANQEILPGDTSHWAQRAGGVAVVKDGYIYMIGGENGFICFPGAPCPPYFNDVWRTRDGEKWEQVTADAGWDKRPGHQVVVAQNRFVLFGGFGLGEDNGQTPSNPRDVWISNKGKVWKKVSDSPWNALLSSEIKYDFDALVVKGRGKDTDAIYTFGGDRETFDRDDPINFTRVDNDVWKFSLPKGKDEEEEIEPKKLTLYPNYPNPFTESTTLKYYVPKKSYVTILIFDRNGRIVKRLFGKKHDAGEYEVEWNGKNYKGREVRKGYYHAAIWSQGKSQTIKMIKQ